MQQIVPISQRGTVTLPKPLREKHKILTPGRVEVKEGPQGVIIKAIPNFLDLYGAIKHKGPPLNFKKLRQEFEEEVAKKANV